MCIGSDVCIGSGFLRFPLEQIMDMYQAELLQT
jgi:hypothetical protein